MEISLILELLGMRALKIAFAPADPILLTINVILNATGFEVLTTQVDIFDCVT